MSRRHTAFALLVAGLALVSLCAHAAKDEGELTVNLFVNYGSAFREKSWAPVDVVIKNERQDVKGWVELQTYSNDVAQSPVYRQPIELPKGSQKRIQFHCYFNGATRLTAQIYDGRRPMLGIPAEFAGLRPIPDDDLLCLVLDDEGGGFQFLYMVVSGENGKRGIHRENLGTDTLPFLSEYPQAYEPINLIVMGNFDPQQVGARQRELIYNYVRNGGVVAVCTGEQARRYGGTWVEDLLGAKVGASEPVDEAALAQAAFAPEDQTKARAGTQVAVAALEPQAEGVERIGGERTLATRRSLGTGCVYGLAVDADSQALQGTRGYQKLWRKITGPRGSVGALNIDAVAGYVSEMLPQISGIVVHSKRSVVTYLLVYFLVAVVGNWLFFNWLKRREWAWAALVVFAIGFTAYAMIFGTAGRAQSSEMHQIQIVRVPQGGGVCTVDSLDGILTARTGRYGMSIQHPYALVEDLYYRDNWMTPQRQGMGIGGTVRPFNLIQGETPRIENFTIGASELRMVRVRTDLELDGGIEGTLVSDSSGLHGELTNRTGFPFEQFFVKYGQQRYDVPVQGDTIRVNITDEAIGARWGEVEGIAEGYYPIAHNSDEFWRTLPLCLFSPMDPRPGESIPHPSDDSIYVYGWSRSRHVPSVVPDVSIAEKTNATLIVADVPLVSRNRAGVAVVRNRADDLRVWAVEHTTSMYNYTIESLPLLTKSVFDAVQQDTSADSVSDLIGSYSHVTQPLGPYKSAAELAFEWGASDKEASEAALWDRMIETWVVTIPEHRPEGLQSMSLPLRGAALALSQDDSSIPPEVDRIRTFHPGDSLGFIQPASLPRVILHRIHDSNWPVAGHSDLSNYFVYALTELWSPDERDVVFAHGSNDWTRIWINGTQVHSNLLARDAAPSQDHFIAHLRPGKNIVLVESGNNMDEWEFSLAFDRGYEGLEVKLPSWAPVQ